MQLHADWCNQGDATAIAAGHDNGTQDGKCFLFGLAFVWSLQRVLMETFKLIPTKAAHRMHTRRKRHKHAFSVSSWTPDFRYPL